VTIVSNTSPITNLAAIEQLDLLQQLYTQIIIPQAVYRELTNIPYPVPGTIEVQTLPWIQTQSVSNRDRVVQLLTELDEGEAEAITLALEINAERVLIDENEGRAVASGLGLNVTGVLGILLIAKNQGLIQFIKPSLDSLIIRAGFRVRDSLYTTILETAGEKKTTA
jgi:predicted nucleic acid-binding protein